MAQHGRKRVDIEILSDDGEKYPTEASTPKVSPAKTNYAGVPLPSTPVGEAVAPEKRKMQMKLVDEKVEKRRVERKGPPPFLMLPRGTKIKRYGNVGFDSVQFCPLMDSQCK